MEGQSPPETHDGMLGVALEVFFASDGGFFILCRGRACQQEAIVLTRVISSNRRFIDDRYMRQK